MTWVRHGECNGCGACCRTLIERLTVRLEPSITEPAYLAARGLMLRDDGTVVATGELVAPCPQLTAENQCRIQATKPQWCQDYPTHPDQVLTKPCSYWFEQDGIRLGGLASLYPGG
jgi:Fe-S-cluster containining protein